jgi:hypothetical protein
MALAFAAMMLAASEASTRQVPLVSTTLFTSKVYPFATPAKH